jgi:hypothetical protein
MKKKLLYLAFSTIFSTAALSSFSGIPDIVSLKGQVKSITDFQYQAKGKEDHPVKGQQIYSSPDEYNYVEFDQKGLKLEQKSFTKANMCSRRLVNKYDKNDSLEEVKIFNGADQLSEKIIYNRDKQGRVIKIEYFDEKKNRTKSITQKFDDAEKTMLWQELDAEGILNKYLEIPQQIFNYNNSAQPVNVDIYTYKDPTTIHKANHAVWSYDPKGNISQYIDYYKNDSIHIIKDYKVNEARIIEMTEEKEYLYSRELSRMTTIHYDSIGNIIDKSVYVADNNKTDKWNYRYEYDANGNYIVKYSFLNGSPETIVERKIAYFPAAGPKQ